MARAPIENKAESITEWSPLEVKARGANIRENDSAENRVKRGTDSNPIERRTLKQPSDGTFDINQDRTENNQHLLRPRTIPPNEKRNRDPYQEVRQDIRHLHSS
jgi:hypothetical protein